jgi:hypothetical protein
LKNYLSPGGVTHDTVYDGTNPTGTYVLRIKLRKGIPQLFLILGKGMNINNPGIPRLCTNCFGYHNKKNCHTKKILWQDYASNFARENRIIANHLFGKWMTKQYQPSPSTSHILVPTTPISPLPSTSTEASITKADWIGCNQTGSQA